MNCDKIRRMLSSYVDGELDSVEKVRVDEHLARCESCRAEIFDLRQSIAALKAVPSDDPGPQFNQAVARRLEEGRERAQVRTALRFKLALGFASVLVLAVLAIPIYVANMDHFMGRQDIYVLGGDTLIPGSNASVRLVVANRGADNPVEGAHVVLALMPADGGRRIRLASGTTDDAGTFDCSFRVPPGLAGDFSLLAQSSSSLGRDSVLFPVKLQRAAKVLLTTDKPVYQPGQVIHLRALALLRPSLKPASGADVRFVIEDPKGNKVFDESVPTSEWGIAATEFQLGDELNLGRYEIKATLDDTETVKTVTVKRYVLPKFKVDLETDRAYYMPGRTIRGTVTTRYFFGKPAANARVQIDLSALSVEYQRFAEIRGRTNPQGVFTFKARTPEFLAGQPAQGGSGLVKIAVRVTDTAQHSEEIVRTLPVAKSPIRIAVVPESGAFAYGLENIVYVVTSYPDGRPAATETTISLDGHRQTARSDALGVSAFRIGVPDDAFELLVTARDAGGLHWNERFEYESRQGSLPERQRFAIEMTEAREDMALPTVLVRTEKAICDVGDTANVVVMSTKSSGSVYLDVVLDSQTVLTRTLHLKDGRAEAALDLSNDHAGTLTFSAYVLPSSGAPVRDTATVLVRAAKELSVSVKPDRETYRPGEEARIDFRVTNREGRGTAAAIGVNIVDESVFSVEEQMPGLSALYFALQEDILKPRYQTKFVVDDEFYRQAYREPEATMRDLLQELFRPRPQLRGELPQWNDPASLLATDRDASIQRAARVLFAAAGLDDAAIAAVTQEVKDRRIRQTREAVFGHGWDSTGPFWVLLIVFVVPVGMATVTAYRRRLPSAMIVCILAVADVAILMTAGLMGAPVVWDASGVRLITLLLATPLWAGALVLSFGTDLVVMIGCGFALFLLMAAILFPVFSRARCSSRRSAMMADLRAAGMALGEPLSAPMPGCAAAPVAAQPVRVRQFFPETLYSNPAVITDESGRGSIELSIADSITTWRISALASSMNGEVGSANARLRVFQDFFIDLDLPVGVTQGDEISVPVAVYNYLPRAQTVTLKLRPGKWFTALGDTAKSARLEANEVTVVYFPIKAAKLGRHSLTVEARSGELADAIKRTVTVYPNGKEQSDVANGVVSADTRAVVHIPREAIQGASKLFVKLYPGAFSQVVDGLDALLKVPYGCFEQTSSITYPNVLILKYLQATKKDRPEISMKAEQYISLGYQRLLTFETAGGGFDWFGRAPANTVLTAYGIMELADMADVATVDRGLIERARKLLEQRQNGDGSWSADRGTHTWSSLNAELSITAYVTWALGEGGFADTRAARSGCDYIIDHLDEADDPYILALAANALVAGDREGAARQALDRLEAFAEVSNDRAMWKSRLSTLTYGSGGVARTETTALAAYAFTKSHTHPRLAEQALAELVATRDQRGSWGTTQATILALKALLAGSTEGVGGSGDVEIIVNGGRADTVRISGDDSQVMRVIDVTDLARAGRNVVEMRARGDARPAYQVVARYYIPWSPVPKPDRGAMSIDVHYGKLRVGRGGVVDVAASVRANDQPVKMAIVDLGIAPGFGVVAEDLEALKAKKIIDRYEITPRQLILYLHDIQPGYDVRIRYRLRALYPVRVTVPASTTYDYYNPATRRSIAKPIKIEVI